MGRRDRVPEWSLEGTAAWLADDPGYSQEEGREQRRFGHAGTSVRTYHICTAVLKCNVQSMDVIWCARRNRLLVTAFDPAVLQNQIFHSSVPSRLDLGAPPQVPHPQFLTPAQTAKQPASHLTHARTHARTARAHVRTRTRAHARMYMHARIL